MSEPIFVTSISKLNQCDWKKVVGSKNIYLSIAYLQAIEDSLHNDIQLFYGIQYNQNGEPLIVGVFQLVQFRYNGQSHSKVILYLLCKYKTKDGFAFPTLVSGNVFANGENGFSWTEELNEKTAFEAMGKMIQQLCLHQKVKNKATIYLFKEFQPNLVLTKILQKFGFKIFEIDVNMVLRINSKWIDFPAYLGSMKTKFRTKAKAVFKKSKELKISSLSSSEIISLSNEIDELFQNVVDRSEYSFSAFEAKSFAKLKSALGENFIFRSVFLNEQLVGFSTGVFNKNILEANYVGLNYELNGTLDIYQRLLYDYVELGIQHKVSEIHFGRTSEMIKSALGAEPVAMKLYAKHAKRFPNLLFKLLGIFIQPRPFELRKPFKQTQ